jgi:hypothetical protein
MRVLLFAFQGSVLSGLVREVAVVSQNATDTLAGHAADVSSLTTQRQHLSLDRSRVYVGRNC